MKRRFAVVPLAALAMAACSDLSTAPVAEEAAAAASTSASFSGSSIGGVSVNFDGDLDAITNRVLPGFDNSTAAGNLRGYIAEIKTQLAAGNKAEVTRLVGLARAETAPGINGLGTTGGNLGWIERLLDRIDQAVAQ